MSSNSEWNNYAGYEKSSYSGGAENCVDVNAVADPARVGIRNTTDGGVGHVLVVPRPAFAAFVAAVRTGEIGQ